MSIRGTAILAATIGLIAVGCGGSDGPESPGVGTVRVASGLSSPVFATHAPGDTTRLFIVENYSGRVLVMNLADNSINATPFLSVTDHSGQGVLGMAFHPDYENNGYFFVYYNYDVGNHVRLARYTRSVDPNVADAASEFVIIEVATPDADHVGGWIGFGPDGYMYVPLGDGGGGGNDPENNGQTIINSLQGAVLRLDVDGDDFPADPDRNYAVPASNPFVGETGDDEIWAYGLRNPFRCSFDHETGDFYIADVGQESREEVNFQPRTSTGGENYGWRLREGTIQNPRAGIGGPRPPGNVDPIHDYPRQDGISITGGCVYRGPVETLRGQYFFADWGTNRIWSLRHDGTRTTQLTEWTEVFAPDAGEINGVTAFGEDALGNVYIVDHTDGEIFRIVSK